jgi:simple sugar transport system ATP-binding protein
VRFEQTKTEGTAGGEQDAHRPSAPESCETAGVAETAGVPVIELRHVSKSFGGVEALHDVSVQLRPAEVLGLIGDNGAGKSTLIKIITGYHRQDSGEILFRGQKVEDLTVRKARALGVEAVYQERALADQQSLWRNIFMGRPLTRPGGFLDVGAMRDVTAKLMGEAMGFTSAILTPDTPVTGLSGGERQGLAIVRALHFQADLIILDEPTMGLSLSETEKCLDFVRGIRAAGKSAIFIDHNIFHVYSIADRIVLLDRGGIAGEFPTSRYSLDELTAIMREVAATGRFSVPRRHADSGR